MLVRTALGDHDVRHEDQASNDQAQDKAPDEVDSAVRDHGLGRLVFLAVGTTRNKSCVSAHFSGLPHDSMQK